MLTWKGARAVPSPTSPVTHRCWCPVDPQVWSFSHSYFYPQGLGGQVFICSQHICGHLSPLWVSPLRVHSSAGKVALCFLLRDSHMSGA